MKYDTYKKLPMDINQWKKSWSDIINNNSRKFWSYLMRKLKLACHASFRRLAPNLQNPTHAGKVSQATSVQDCTGHELSRTPLPAWKCWKCWFVHRGLWFRSLLQSYTQQAQFFALLVRWCYFQNENSSVAKPMKVSVQMPDVFP